jgi:hypothetical protein
MMSRSTTTASSLPSRALRRPGPYRLIAVPVAHGRRGTFTRAVFRVLP